MKTEYIVVDRHERLLESILKDAVTFSFLLLCIYVSKESAWWTFLTGTLFIFFGTAAISKWFSGLKTLNFKRKSDLIQWVNSVEWKED